MRVLWQLRCNVPVPGGRWLVIALQERAAAAGRERVGGGRPPLPCPAGLVAVPGGGLAVVAEGVRGDGGERALGSVARVADE